MAWYLLRKTINGLLGLALAAGLSVAVPVYAQASSSSTVPLYWLNVSSADEPGEFGWIMDFLLTTSPDEVASAQALGWESGGIIGYISPVPAPGLVPLHRYYSPSATDHYYTTDPSEGAYALSIGYTDESITGYVVPAESALSVFEDTVPLYRYADLSAERNYHFYSTTLNPTYESYFQKTEGRLWTSEQNLCTVKVEYPNGWETLTGGEPVNVTWSTSLPGGYVQILYSTDNGSTWNAITDPAITNAGTTGSFAWTVPNIDADHVLARAEWYNQLLVPFVTLAKDLSDQEFKIKSSGTFATITLNPIYLTELTSAESVPSDLTATIESNISIKLDWSDNATGETGYIIERKDGSNDWQEIVTLAADSQSYTDSSCSPATQYTYRVEATYGGSMTASSNEATATTSGLLISAVTMNHNPALEEYPNQGTVTTITLIFTLDSNSFTSNGQVQDMDVAPVIVDNRVLLPLRFVSVPLGATPEWKAVEGKAVITLGATVLEIWPGQAEASLNGQKVYLDPDNHNVTAIVDSGRVMVPLRFVAESLGAIPDWNSSTQEITITK